ncbi:MAG: transposase [Gemmatimonadota bacterium]|jgi:transposase
MASGREVYQPEFKRRIVELVWTGRSPEELAKEFEPSPNTIRTWAIQADLDEGSRADGLTRAERKEPRELRRKVKQMELEREILGKAAARPTLRVGARLGSRLPFRSVRIREGESGRLPGSDDVSGVGGVAERRRRCMAPALNAS